MWLMYLMCLCGLIYILLGLNVLLYVIISECLQYAILIDLIASAVRQYIYIGTKIGMEYKYAHKTAVGILSNNLDHS